MSDFNLNKIVLFTKKLIYNGNMNAKETINKIKPFLGLFLIALFTCFVMDSSRGTLLSGRYIMTLVIAVAVIWLMRRYVKFSDVTVILGSGVLIRWLYILYTEVWERQHDVVAFNCGEGQAAYIEYFLTNKSLPQFDPRSVWGFFQPPLHHIISAVWMKISFFLGCSENQAQENIQGLTFLYISAVLILAYYIFCELELKKWGMRVALLLVALHPVYILLSGSINNDALSLLFMVLSLYLAMRWYKKPGMITIVLLGFSIGLAMFAKLSGYMIAPAVAVLFVLKLIEDKENIRKYIFEYIVFGIICVPIGLFWTIRNMVRFGMPVNYIPEVGGQFENGIFTRLFDFKMTSVFPALVENGDAYYEHNIFLSMIKTSLFGEYNYANISGLFNPVCILLFTVGTVLAIMAFVATIIVIFSKKSSLKREWKWLFGVLYVTVMGSYLGFALSYSNFSAEDFRYAAIVIIVQAAMLGIYTDTCDADEKGSNKILKSIIIGATALFGACSLITYILLGILG